MAKQVIHGEDSRAAILRGVNQLADAVKVTPTDRDGRFTITVGPEPGETAPLDRPHQDQDQKDDQDQAQPAARVVAPVAAVRVNRQCPEEQQQHDDQQDRA